LHEPLSREVFEHRVTDEVSSREVFERRVTDEVSSREVFERSRAPSRAEPRESKREATPGSSTKATPLPEVPEPLVSAQGARSRAPSRAEPRESKRDWRFGS
jgi:hypothetical protein